MRLLRAFTIIEVLVVVAIIMIIAAVVIPNVAARRGVKEPQVIEFTP